MSLALPHLIDTRRAVERAESYAGAVGPARLTRLADLIDGSRGWVEATLGFGEDQVGVPTVQLTIDAELWLQCQRSLEWFVHSVAVRQTLAVHLAGSPEPAEGMYELTAPLAERCDPLTLIEDELILALPAVPVAPDAPPLAELLPTTPIPESPFAALATLRPS